MDDRPKPLLLLELSQTKVLSTFEPKEKVSAVVCLPPPEDGLEQPDLNLAYATPYAQQVSEAREIVGDTPLVGRLPAIEPAIEPFGELPYANAVSLYAAQAAAWAAAGCVAVLAEGLTTLASARAALLGARRAGIPLWATVSLDGDSQRLEDGAELATVFVVLQSMGVAAFGIAQPDTGDGMLPLLEQLAPYAKIPLLARPECLTEDRQEVLTPAQFGQLVGSFVAAGVSICGAGYGAGSSHLLAAKARLEEDTPAQREADHEDVILLTTAREVFYLDENLELSPPLPCGVDMSEELIELEDSGCDVICVRVETPDDAYHLSLNSHLANLPIALLSDCPEALESALFYHHGRGIIDSRSHLDRGVLDSLALRYGAVVV